MSRGIVTLFLVGGALAEGGDKPKDGKPGDGKKADPAKHAEGMLKAMTEHLQLTQDQQGKIKPILDNMASEMKKIMDDSSLSQQDKKTKFMNMRNSSMEKIKAQLTPQQQEKMKAMMEHHKKGEHEKDKKQGGESNKKKDGN